MKYLAPVYFSPGTVVHHHYEVERYLGMGSSGIVYACRHLDIESHPIAMKVFTKSGPDLKAQQERFKREILAAYQVNHPNVVRCFEFISEEGFMAYTMEYLAGGNLADKLHRDGCFSIDQIVRMLLAMSSGLAAIHAAGIIHRDLKPANILITSEGNLKISDFGTAHVRGSNQMSAQGLPGTIEYMSPEYVHHGKCDFRSDIFALGIIGYELLTGRLPFTGETAVDSIWARLEQDPEPIEKFRAECPILLRQIIARCLAKNPEARFQSAADLHGELQYLHTLMWRNNFLEKSKIVRTAADDPILRPDWDGPSERQPASYPEDRIARPTLHPELLCPTVMLELRSRMQGFYLGASALLVALTIGIWCMSAPATSPLLHPSASIESGNPRLDAIELSVR